MLTVSRFYLSADNSRGNMVTAAGRSSGQTAHLRGWNVGVRVCARPKPLDHERDCFDIYATGGSHDGAPAFRIGTVQMTASGRIVFAPSGELETEASL